MDSAGGKYPTASATGSSCCDFWSGDAFVDADCGAMLTLATVLSSGSFASGSNISFRNLQEWQRWMLHHSITEYGILNKCRYNCIQDKSGFNIAAIMCCTSYPPSISLLVCQLCLHFFVSMARLLSLCLKTSYLLLLNQTFYCQYSNAAQGTARTLHISFMYHSCLSIRWSSQVLCLSPLSQLSGSLSYNLQPRRAPATAPLVSASPACCTDKGR